MGSTTSSNRPVSAEESSSHAAANQLADVRLPFATLASDLDGTLLPLDNNAQHRRDLWQLQLLLGRAEMELMFVTGRHFESVSDVLQAQKLPSPPWIACDVGTSIFQRQSDGSFERVLAYSDHLANIIGEHSVERLHAELARESAISQGLRKQESEKQTQFKLSYYAASAAVPELHRAIDEFLSTHAYPYSVIASVDPFTGDGLIDLLPRGASKAMALKWWTEFRGLSEEQVIYAGDSGNDSAVFAAGFASIIVANADEHVVSEARHAHAQAGWNARLYRAQQTATSGVLEGLAHFLKRSAAPPS